MAYTLLQMVKKILEVLDSEDVNSIGDSVEAQQVASFVEDCYWDLIANRKIPEHQTLLKLVSVSDSDRPTNFTLPTGTKEISKLFYNCGTTTEPDYKEIYWQEPQDFLYNCIQRSEDYDVVSEINSGVYLNIGNNDWPQYYTSFDDTNIILNSYSSDDESVLTTDRTMAYGYSYPTFDANDDEFTPSLDDNLFPLLLREAQAMAMDVLKGGVTAKVEQAARRNRSAKQNDMYRTPTASRWNNFGRT
jgi:hypothetical protein